MKHEEEKVLTEAATSNQDKAKPLYEDSNISVLIAQVLTQAVELIRLAGEGKRRFATYYGGIYLSVWETKANDNGTYEYVRDLVNVLIDANKGEKLMSKLSDAVQTMCREVGTVRKELGYGKE